jgi:hypothetical protein
MAIDRIPGVGPTNSDIANAIITPSGTTEDRPENPQIGDQFYNGTTATLEIYTSGGWVSASGANDFFITVTGAVTSTQMNKTVSAGDYTISSAQSDGTYDLYIFAADGASAGYTKNSALTAEKSFNKVVLLGGTIGDTITFTYKNTYASTATSSELLAGPFITSASTSSMPNQDDTVVITGGNFASDVEVSFTGTGYSSTPAKSITRTSSASLTVTRPDNFPPTSAPYTITITNPGVTSPTGTGLHILSNAITSAGAAPVWVTTSPLSTFTYNTSYSATLSATDANGSVSYSVVSGSLPTGLSLSSSTGVISGTPTSSSNSTFTVRATDLGGNYVDREFLIPNTSPTWITGTTLTSFTKNTSYSVQLSAVDDSENALSYSLVSGSLPTGLSLSSSGLLSGTPTSTSSASFSVRATDNAGNYSDQSFTLPNVGPTWVTSSVPAFTSGSSYSYQLSATDDSGTVTYTLQSGALPSGLSISSGGLISGTSSASIAVYIFTVRASDGSSYSDRQFTMSGGSSSYGVTGSQQTFTAPVAGTYRLTVYGGRGGTTSDSSGGAGGSATGTVTLTSGEALYIYVGGAGGTGNSVGYNGGGTGGSGIGAGGGGTDIRRGGTSLSNRIIVAGGGGGQYPSLIAGNGGGTNGGNPTTNNGTNITGGTQSSGGNYGGTFGSGGNWNGNYNGAGGGGGWYGGGSNGSGAPACNSGGGGGSGYIGGVTNGSMSSGVNNGGGSAVIELI